MIQPLSPHGYPPAPPVQLNRLVTHPSPSSFNHLGQPHSLINWQSTRRRPLAHVSHTQSLRPYSGAKFLSLARTSPVYCLKYTGSPSIDTTTVPISNQPNEKNEQFDTSERRLYSFPLSPDLNRSPDVCIASTMMLDYTGFQPHIIAVISCPHQ
jgi:hypothetical protein